MKSIALLLGGFLFSAMIAESVTAAPILDQSFEPEFTSAAFIGSGNVAQTFKVGQAGILTKVDLPLAFIAEPTSTIVTLPGNGRSVVFPDTPQPPSLLILDILGIVGGLPDENRVLAQVSISTPHVSNLPYDWISFDFGSLGLNVTADEILALKIHSDTASIEAIWIGQEGAEIASGKAFHKLTYSNEPWVPYTVFKPADYGPGPVVGNAGTISPVSFGFRTYVEPVPEPSTFVMLFAGLVAMLGYAKRRPRQF